MAAKSVSIRIEEEMLAKIGYIADYEGRSVNYQVHGKIEGTVRPEINVKPPRKGG